MCYYLVGSDEKKVNGLGRKSCVLERGRCGRVKGRDSDAPVVGRVKYSNAMLVYT